MDEEEWYNREIVGVATEADIRNEINKRITIADIQKGIEKKKKQETRPTEHRTQLESRSVETTGK